MMRSATTFLIALVVLLGLTLTEATAQCFQNSAGFSAELLIDGANSDGSYTYVWDVSYGDNTLWIRKIWFQTTGDGTESVTVRPEYSTWTSTVVASAPGTGAPAINFQYVSGLKLQRNRAFTFAYTTSFQDPVRVTAELSNGSMLNLNFTSATCGNLPVELTAFEAQADGHQAVVMWQTASETNNAGFSVELRRSGEANFMALGFVAGHGTTLEAKQYRFRTETLEPGRYEFRLRQVDFDGAENFSAPQALEIAAAEAFFVRPFANPLRGQADVAFVAQRTEHVQVDLYNAVGQRVASLFEGLAGQGERIEARLDARSLPAGIYLMRFAGETAQRTVRVVVVD